MQIGKKANQTVLEIGVGYGRLAEIVIQRGTKKYIIVDIFPMIYLAEQYLRARFPSVQIFSVRDFSNFAEVADEIEQAQIVFLSPSQFQSLPDKYVDLVININSFMEMSAEEVEYYFFNIDIISRGHLYTKQWKQNKLNKNVQSFSKISYPIRSHWRIRMDREDPLHSDFFEEIWSIEGT